MISVEAAVEDVIPQLLELEREVFTNPWSKEMFWTEFKSPDSFFSVLYDNNIPAGYCILRQITEEEGQVFNIAVAPSSRRRKFGDALMRIALRDAEDAGIKSVFLEVRESNAPAIALYENHGFKRIGLRKGYYDKPDEDALVMEKSIIPGQSRGCCAGGK